MAEIKATMASEQAGKDGHQTVPELARLAEAASALYQAGRLAEAETAYRAALAFAPDNPAVMLNLGVVAAARGQYREAIALFDAAIARRPRYAAAYYNRALAALSLGERQAAIGDLTGVCALQPEHYDAHRTLGFLWLAQGNRDRALDHFARTYELRRGDDRSDLAAKSLTQATRDKLLHDAEQFRFLAGRHQSQRFAALARAYEDVGRDFPETLETLSARQIDRLGEDYNGPIHLGAAAEIAGGALSARSDLGAIVGAFRANPAGAVTFDDLLSPEALKRLKAFLLESTIWHDFNHIGGFVASYLEDGLACPLILQIAAEIRSRFAVLLEQQPLTQAWAFKGLKPASAIDIHADDGAVSLNLWLTPDAANRKPDRGGLVVSMIPPPDDWSIGDYAADQERIAAFLQRAPQQRLTVPYKENRAVLFRSRLFHWSDAPEFADGYENHRINLTLIYGRGGTAVAPAARP